MEEAALSPLSGPCRSCFRKLSLLWRTSPVNAALERMPTGIPGLDYLLEGGLLRGNSLLIEGPPGSGKSTFGVRMLHEGIIQYQEPELLITFEEFPKQGYEEAM